MPEILTGILSEDRLDRIRAISAGDSVQGGQPDADGMTPNDNNHVFDLACSITKVRDDLIRFTERNVYFGYDPDQFYLPFDKVIIREAGSLHRDVYQVYDPAGCKSIDPRDPVNRPAGWNATDPTMPYKWIKLPSSGERGQIGAIRIAMSHLQQENELPFVGGTFTLKAGLIPWLYESVLGTLPPSITEDLSFGMRDDDFMRFVAKNNLRALLNPQDDAAQKHYHTFTEHGNVINLYTAPGAQNSTLTDQGLKSSSTSYNTGRTADETRPVNTALTAFITI